MKTLVIFTLLSLPAFAQTYNARTDLTAQPYPGSIPCPGPSCSAFGTFTGANFQFTPSDFATSFIRITDNSTTASNHQGFTANCDDSSEGNDFNTLSNRFVLCQRGNIQTIFSWTGTAATQITNSTWSLANGYINGQSFYSYTQPYTLYHAHPCPAATAGCTQHDLTIFQADTSGGGNPPTPTVVVDLNTACGLANYAGAAFEDGVTVSRDDQTFSFNLCNSGTCGQGSAGNVYGGVWNRSTGCSYLNTSTWQVFNNGTLLGTASGTAQNFTMHNSRVTQDGSLLRLSIGTCTSCVGGRNSWLAWVPFALTVTPSTDGNGCGHLVNGYSHIANKCSGNVNINGLGYYPFSTLNTWTSLPAAYPTSSDANMAHLNWSNDNTTDTNPFFVSMQWTGSFAANFPWDQELLGVATNGSGRVYRFAHHYSTPTAQAFVPINVSQDGKYLLVSTDWDQMLGCSNGTTLGCGPNQPDWAGTHAYAANALVTPLTGNSGGYSYQTSGGTSGGSQPSPWNQSVGGTSSDGTLTWTNVGLYRSDVFLLPLPLYSGVTFQGGFISSGGVTFR